MSQAGGVESAGSAEDRLTLDIIASFTDGFILLDRDWRVVLVNDAAERLLGTPRAALLGRTHWEAYPATVGTIVEREYRRAVREHCTTEFEFLFSPWQRWFSTRAYPTAAGGLSVLFSETTERHRTEAFQAGQKRVLELISEGAGLSKVLEALCRLVEEWTSGGRASILLLDRDGKHLRHGAAPSLAPAYNSAIDGLPIGPEVGTCGRVAFLGHEMITPDISTDPCWSAFRELAEQHHLRSCWSTPILRGDGGILGTFAIYTDEPAEPTPRDREVVATISQTASVAISRALAEEEGKSARDQAHRILESITDGFYALNAEWRFTYVNQEAERTLQRTREQLIGKVIWDEFPEAVDAAFGHQYRDALQNKTAVHFEAYYPPLDGWFEVHAYPSGDGLSVYFRTITDRKRADMRDALLMRVDDALRVLSDPYAITQQVAQLLGEHLEVNRCAYADVEDDEDTFNLTGDFNRDVPSIVGRYTFAQFGAECLRLMREGLPYVVEDSESDPRTEEVRVAYRATLIRSVICVSLLKGKRFVGAMAVHQITPRRWRPDEVELVQAVANRCWESIERARVARELRASEERYRLERERLARVFAQAPVSICVFRGRDMVYELANPEYQEFLPNRQLVGRAITDVIPELDPEILAILHKVFDTAEPFRANEFYVPLDRDRDGVVEDYWFNLVFHPLVEYDDNVSGVIVVAVDVTTHVQATREIKHQWRVFDTVLSHTPDHAYIIDRRGRFLYANRSLLTLWQKSFEEVAGKNGYEIGFPLELATTVERQVQQVVETRQQLSGEVWFPDPEGVTRYYEYLFAPIFGSDGSVEAIAGSSRDIAERKYAEQLLHQQSEALRRSNRELEEFAHVASHDLQEPLRMVHSYSQLLVRSLGEKATPQQTDFVNIVLRGVKRMEQLIADLLSYSQTVHTAEDAELSEASLEEALRQALSLVESRVVETRAEITREPLPVVRGDTAQIAHVFQNVLSNALKYSHADRTPRIDIAAMRDGRDWVVSIRDNGIGFEPDQSERIFGLFKRLHSQTKYSGTGLGLAICKRIVERFGGRMWAEGEPGVGATFYFSLPAAHGQG